VFYRANRGKKADESSVPVRNEWNRLILSLQHTPIKNNLFKFKLFFKSSQEFYRGSQNLHTNLTDLKHFADYYTTILTQNNAIKVRNNF
jgi:hypothetical protein